jgi:hypothetical protein
MHKPSAATKEQVGQDVFSRAGQGHQAKAACRLASTAWWEPSSTTMVFMSQAASSLEIVFSCLVVAPKHAVQLVPGTDKDLDKPCQAFALVCSGPGT